MAEVLIEGAEYLRCEIAQAARREMIVELDDFLRRRSKIALVIDRKALRGAPGLLEACRMLFGPQAEAKYWQYFANLETAGAPEGQRTGLEKEDGRDRPRP